MKELFFQARGMQYLHQLSDWPSFKYDRLALADRLSTVRCQLEQLLARIALSEEAVREEVELMTLTSDIEKSSAIEGERFATAQVRSALARTLSLERPGLVPSRREVEGAVAMTVDAVRRYREPLTVERLWHWHRLLFPSVSDEAIDRRVVGAWRTDSLGAMQIVSGPIGQESVHFEAPPAQRVDGEMRDFLKWFNAPFRPDPLLKAGIAHLWFESIHPFDDGNGRIGRAIINCALAGADGLPQRFYTLSTQIARERKGYYAALARMQEGKSMDCTAWLLWFLDSLERAIEDANATFAAAATKLRVWQECKQVPLNERQERILHRLLEDFRGRLTSEKYAKLAKCSRERALADIKVLISYGLLKKEAERGRKTSYVLVEH